ncbi:N-6 DNA methylase [Streptomyces sp. NPDC051214]|uniref:HsdM family class I SAM-dependent methyltransferase n=1 Tax=Streptomyces sp. NPDC051214 TaxID=3155282 RepID=UPI00342BBA1A
MEAAEQLTYLLMLKIEDEQVPGRGAVAAGRGALSEPEPCGWGALLALRGSELVTRYSQILDRRSRRESGTALDAVFAGAQNQIPDGALLHRLVFDLFEARRWTFQEAGLLCEAYDALLAKAVNDIRTGAGQYFTPRPLIDAVVAALRPELSDTVTDPACGTGGFLIGVHHYLARHQLLEATQEERERWNREQIWGQELVPGTARLATANLLLHSMGALGRPPQITVGDTLAHPPHRRASLVLAHPPFGRRAGVPGQAPGAAHRESTDARSDFVTGASEKHIDFLQHVMSLTAAPGRAAVIVPDSIFYAAGAAARVREHLLDRFDVHTVLRLPAGMFHSSVQASVIFFDRPAHPAPGPQTTQIWVYDLRSRRPSAPVITPPTRSDLDDFVSVYRPGRPRTRRVQTQDFRCFDVKDVLNVNGTRLDLTWPQKPPHTDSLATPQAIAQDIVDGLTVALQEFAELAAKLQGE